MAEFKGPNEWLPKTIELLSEAVLALIEADMTPRVKQTCKQGLITCVALLDALADPSSAVTLEAYNEIVTRIEKIEVDARNRAVAKATEN